MTRLDIGFSALFAAVLLSCSQESKPAPARGKKDVAAPDLAAVLAGHLRSLETGGVTVQTKQDAAGLASVFEVGATKEEQILDVLIALGTQRDDEEGTFRSASVFVMNLDMIEEAGDYTFLARRIRAMAKGGLPIEGIEDSLDPGGKKARLTFRLGTKKYSWEARVLRQTVDREILRRFARLLHKHGKVALYHVPLRGDRWLLGCANSAQFEALRKLGVNAKWIRRD